MCTNMNLFYCKLFNYFHRKKFEELRSFLGGERVVSKFYSLRNCRNFHEIEEVKCCDVRDMLNH